MICGEASCERILTKYRTSRDIAHLIICTKFGSTCTLYRYTEVQTLVSHIQTAGHPYNYVIKSSVLAT